MTPFNTTRSLLLLPFFITSCSVLDTTWAFASSSSVASSHRAPTTLLSATPTGGDFDAARAKSFVNKSFAFVRELNREMAVVDSSNVNSKQQQQQDDLALDRFQQWLNQGIDLMDLAASQQPTSQTTSRRVSMVAVPSGKDSSRCMYEARVTIPGVSLDQLQVRRNEEDYIISIVGERYDGTTVSEQVDASSVSSSVDWGQLTAALQDGILTLRAPFLEPRTPSSRSIPIVPGGSD